MPGLLSPNVERGRMCSVCCLAVRQRTFRTRQASLAAVAMAGEEAVVDIRQ